MSMLMENLFDTLIKFNSELLPCVIYISVLLVSSCFLQDTFVLITMFMANFILVCWYPSQIRMNQCPKTILNQIKPG